MEEFFFALCLVALGILVAQFLARSSVADGQFILPPDTSVASTPHSTLFDRVANLFQASQGRPLASAQALWEGNASELSRKLAKQGGITTSMDQAILLQQPY